MGSADESPNGSPKAEQFAWAPPAGARDAAAAKPGGADRFAANTDLTGKPAPEVVLNDLADKEVKPLADAKVFPDMVVQMIGVGEQTGALDQMLNKIADFYEEEVDVAVAAMTSMIEPLMMVVVGGMVGFLLIAMYLPIFDIAGKVSEQH